LINGDYAERRPMLVIKMLRPFDPMPPSARCVWSRCS